MPIFEYQARDSTGKSVQGEVSTPTTQEAIQSLRDQDFLVISLKEKALSKDTSSRTSVWKLSGRVKGKVLVAFTHQLATLLGAGVPLLECLDMLSSQEEDPTFSQMVSDIRDEVEKGTTLAEGLRKFPAVFQPFYLNMVEVGEATGQLDESLSQLAQYLERQAQLRAKIVSGLAYPILLVGVALTVLGFLLVWVVPLFSGLFHEMGQSLPWLTQMVISFAEALRGYLWQLGLLIFGLILGIRMLWTRPNGRLFVDRWLLQIPLIGEVLRKGAVVRFARTLGFLLQRGIPLVTAMGVSGSVTDNAVFQDHVSRSTEQLQDGIPLSLALQGPRVFPPLVSQMVKVGESTGSLDSMLHKIAELFEKEVDQTVATLTSLLEPLVILFVGSGIALVVVAMYLPIFSMGSLLG